MNKLSDRLKVYFRDNRSMEPDELIVAVEELEKQADESVQSYGAWMRLVKDRDIWKKACELLVTDIALHWYQQAKHLLEAQ